MMAAPPFPSHLLLLGDHCASALLPAAELPSRLVATRAYFLYRCKPIGCCLGMCHCILIYWSLHLYRNISNEYWLRSFNGSWFLPSQVCIWALAWSRLQWSELPQSYVPGGLLWWYGSTGPVGNHFGKLEKLGSKPTGGCSNSNGNPATSGHMEDGLKQKYSTWGQSNTGVTLAYLYCSVAMQPCE